MTCRPFRAAPAEKTSPMTAEPAITGREHWTHKGPVSQPAPVYRGA